MLQNISTVYRNSEVLYNSKTINQQLKKLKRSLARNQLWAKKQSFQLFFPLFYCLIFDVFSVVYAWNAQWYVSYLSFASEKEVAT